jgi:beta-lactamase class D
MPHRLGRWDKSQNDYAAKAQDEQARQAEKTSSRNYHNFISSQYDPKNRTVYTYVLRSSS